MIYTLSKEVRVCVKLVPYVAKYPSLALTPLGKERLMVGEVILNHRKNQNEYIRTNRQNPIEVP